MILPAPVFQDAARRAAALLRTLYARLGPQGWWPVRSSDPVARAVEICVGAVLVQNTSWTQVDRVLKTLGDQGLFCCRRLVDIPLPQLARLTRSAGYPNVKPKRVQALMQFMLDHADGDPRRLAGSRMDDDPSAIAELRAQLLAVHGIGPETADCILLYVLDLPVMVADTYAWRVATRHGLLDTTCKYNDVQTLWAEAADLWAATEPTLSRVQCCNEAHALLVAVGKTACRTQPRCAGCVLEADR